MSVAVESCAREEGSGCSLKGGEERSDLMLYELHGVCVWHSYVMPLLRVTAFISYMPASFRLSVVPCIFPCAPAPFAVLSPPVSPHPYCRERSSSPSAAKQEVDGILPGPSPQGLPLDRGWSASSG